MCHKICRRMSSLELFRVQLPGTHLTGNNICNHFTSNKIKYVNPPFNTNLIAFSSFTSLVTMLHTTNPLPPVGYDHNLDRQSLLQFVFKINCLLVSLTMNMARNKQSKPVLSFLTSLTY